MSMCWWSGLSMCRGEVWAVLAVLLRCHLQHSGEVWAVLAVSLRCPLQHEPVERKSACEARRASNRCGVF
jgi:hypothetical protein